MAFKHSVGSSIFLTTLLLLSVSHVQAESPANAAATPDPKMEAWIKASTPGEEHKILHRYVGKWNHTVKWWMKPHSEPQVSQGSTAIESIMGGRFIEQKVTGTSMGQPFEGLGITGFDNIKKEFSTFWIDNMGTGSMIGKATFDKSKNAIVDQGSFSCPMSPTGTQSYRAVWTLPEKDSFKYEMYINGEDGKEFRMMEIVYSKAK